MYRLNTEKYCRLSSGRARRGLLPRKLQGCREVRQMPRARAHDRVPRGAAHQPGAGSGGAEDPGYSAQVFPLRARCPGVSALQRKDSLSALERGEAAIQGTPLFSDRTFTSHMGKPVLGAQPLPVRCQGAPVPKSPESPKPASVSGGVSETCPLSPSAAPRGRMGLAAAGSTIPFWRYLPGELLLLLLLPQPVCLRNISEYTLLMAMRLQPFQNLECSWGKAAATTGERDPSASVRHPFCLSPHPCYTLVLVEIIPDTSWVR